MAQRWVTEEELQQLTQTFEQGGSPQGSNPLEDFFNQLPPELQEKIQMLPPEKQQEVLMQLMERYSQQQQQFAEGGRAEGIPVEAERNETLTTQDGSIPNTEGGYLEKKSFNPISGQATYEIPDNEHNQTHPEGGVNMVLKEGDVVNSDKTKIPTDFKVYGKNFKGKTFKEASDFLSKKEEGIQKQLTELQKEGKADRVSENSVSIMLAKAAINRNELNELQEQVLASKKQKEHNQSLEGNIKQFGGLVKNATKAEEVYNKTLDRFLNGYTTERPVLKAEKGLSASISKMQSFTDKIAANPNMSTQDVMAAFKQSGLYNQPSESTAIYKPNFAPIKNGSSVVGNFKEMIASKESNAYKNPYIAMSGIDEATASKLTYNELRPKAASSAIGKYQIVWDLHKNDIKKVTGISDPEVFRRNPKAQESFMDWFRDNRLLPQATQVKQKYQVPMSIEQIMAGIHLEGMGSEKKKNGFIGKYLSGQLNTSTMAGNFKNASTSNYMQGFEHGGYISTKYYTPSESTSTPLNKGQVNPSKIIGRSPNLNKDSLGENLFEMFDPTGVSSWDDVSRAWSDGNFNSDDIIQPLTAVPILGKLGKLPQGLKIGKDVYKAGSMIKLLKGLNIEESLKDTYNDNIKKYGGYAKDGFNFKEAGGKIYANPGVTLPILGHKAINQFENTKGNPFGQSMQMGDNYSQSAEPKIIKFITDNIGEDTWNKMPPQLQTQVYSFAFNSKQDDRIFKGLATAINPNEVYKGQSDLDVARQNLDLQKALQMIRGADFSDPTIYNNYIDQILPQQYQSIADNYSGGFDKGQDIYNATWKNRATDIAKIFTDLTYEQNNPFSTWQGDKFTEPPAGYNTVPVNKADYSADDLLTVAKRLSPYSPISSNTQLQELIRDNYKKLTGKDITKIPFSTSNKDLIDGKFGDDWKDAISYFLKDQPDLSATDPELEDFTVYANKPNPNVVGGSKANSLKNERGKKSTTTSTPGQNNQNKTSWLDKLKYGMRESLPYLDNLRLMREGRIMPTLQQRPYDNPYDNMRTDYNIQSNLNENQRALLTTIADSTGNPSVRNDRLAQLAANAANMNNQLYSQKYNQELAMENQKTLGQGNYRNQFNLDNMNLQKRYEQEVLQTIENQRQQKHMASNKMMNDYLRKQEQDQARDLALLETNYDWNPYTGKYEFNKEKAERNMAYKKATFSSSSNKNSGIITIGGNKYIKKKNGNLECLDCDDKSQTTK